MMNMKTNDIISKLGFTELNPMQEDVANAFLHSDKDLVVLSPTGSGKTLAYLLPMVQRLNLASDDLQAIVIVPGRELALQSSNVLKSMGVGARGCACYGGRAAMDEHLVLRQVRPHVVFGTPGRLLDHIGKGNIALDQLKYVVIDEFDKCLEMGFAREMTSLMQEFSHAARRVLLSATDADEIPNYVNMTRTERINYLDADEQVPQRVSIYQVRSPQKDKLDTLARLLRHLGEESSIVFLNYRDSVERTDAFLRAQGFATSAFHGGMEQKAREDALYKFSNGSANVFVSTDLASRGLDIPSISNIIHYHLPESEDGYVHRVGRTARWDATGHAFFVLGPTEEVPQYVDADVTEYPLPDVLPAPAKPKMVTIYIGKGKKDKISKGDIVGFLCKKGGLKMSEIGRVDVNDRYAYAAISRPMLSQVLKLTSGEKIKGIKTIVELVE